MTSSPEKEIGKTVSDALKKLLSEKHLYQYVQVDVSFIEKLLDEDATILHDDPEAVTVIPPFRTRDEAKSELMDRLLTSYWRPTCEDDKSSGGSPFEVDTIDFELPSVLTYCDECNCLWPFSAVTRGTIFPVFGVTDGQCFCLSYQCQNCRGRPIWFLVRRDGLKLRFCGRDPIENLPVPKALPKGINKYYGNAQIAHHAGQTLAGLFLLRVFIEQFWRTMPEVKTLLRADQRATGEAQGDAYQGALPNDFKARFPSLKDVYGKLSAAMHAIDSDEANENLFEESCAKIVRHFEARRLYELS